MSLEISVEHLKLKSSRLGHKCLSCMYFSVPCITKPMTVVTDMNLRQFNDTVEVCKHVIILNLS
jgi:hypothetical protein